MPLLLPVAVILVLGAVTLASRTSNSWSIATRQSDIQAARQAAESGMNRVLSALNPYAKYNSDSYLSFLLLSQWQDATSTSAGTWKLIASGRDSSSMQDLLRSCGLSARGVHPNHLPPSTYSNLLSGTIGTTGTNAKLRYKILDYVPPERPPDQANMPSWPSSCDDFTSLSGGSAQITIEGTVERPKSGSSGEIVVARYTLTRNLDVQAWPMLDLPAEWLNYKVLSVFPGPPIGLRIGNQATIQASLTSSIYANFETDATPQPLSNTFGDFRPQCSSCISSSFTNGFTPLIPTGDRDLPRFYPFRTDDPVKTYRSTPSQWKAPADLLASQQAGGSAINIPYKNASNNQNQLQDYCYKIDSHLDPGRPNEIDCWINSIGPGVNLIVNTQDSPVNLIILGNVGANDNLSSSQKPNPSTPPNQVPTTAFVTIKHCVANCGTASPVYYNHNQLNNFKPVYRYLWNRLRIFGQRPDANQSVCNANQTFHIRSAYNETNQNESSLAGAFLWLPRGSLVFGNRQDANGRLWVFNASSADYVAASPEAIPAQMLSSWWICNLDFRLSGSMNFIMPFYANPDAVAAILPGAYQGANNNLVSDLRFPVYPILPRIRNVY